MNAGEYKSFFYDLSDHFKILLRKYFPNNKFTEQDIPYIFGIIKEMEMQFVSNLKTQLSQEKFNTIFEIYKEYNKMSLEKMNEYMNHFSKMNKKITEDYLYQKEESYKN